MIQFIVGLIIGGTVGLVVTAVLVASKMGDENDFQ